MELSIVIPFYNEEENIRLMYDDILRNIEGKYEFEILMIDDGSTDRGYIILEDIAKKDTRVRVIKFNRNYGQTAALSAGFDFAQGDIIIPMDGDLQNDPCSIPILLSKLNEGYDAVSGWRKERKDAFMTKKAVSWIANYIISKITGIYLHDYGCTLKAYRRATIKSIHLYGEMHRFIPAYIAWNGGKITEVIVNHRPRMYGSTKYDIRRILKVVLDLLTVKFLMDYSTRPMHFFGGAGFILFMLGFFAGSIAIALKVVGYANFNRTPLPLMTIFFLLLGVQFILMGLLAEILVRIYFESNNRKIYKVQKKINLT